MPIKDIHNHPRTAYNMAMLDIQSAREALMTARETLPPTATAARTALGKLINDTQRTLTFIRNDRPESKR
jgi:hypothetical protein